MPAANAMRLSWRAFDKSAITVFLAERGRPRKGELPVVANESFLKTNSLPTLTVFCLQSKRLGKSKVATTRG